MIAFGFDYKMYLNIYESFGSDQKKKHCSYLYRSGI